MLRQVSLAWLLPIAVMAGCSARSKETDSQCSRSNPPVAVIGSVRGTVTLRGEAPPQKPINPRALTGVPLQVPQGLRTERVVVDANNRMQWVLVYIKAGLTNVPNASSPQPRQLAFQGLRYEPHALGVMSGQVLRIRNADVEDHYFHCTGQNEVTKLLHGGDVFEVTFPQEEVMALLKCDMHPWERGWIGVLPHPYYAVSGPGGSYDIRGLPAGKYTLEAWHEFYRPVTKEIEIKDGIPLTTDIVLEERQRP